MAYRITDARVLQAVDRIVRDIDKRYDECLVDRFLEFIESSDAGDKSFSDSIFVLNHIKYFTDHKAFVMLNQARAFKTFYSILKRSELQEEQFNHILPHLNSLWSTIDIIIINDNLAAMTVMLSIFTHLSNSKFGHSWLMNQKIEPSLKLSRIELKDITSLVEHLLDCKNYHTRNKVENLLEQLICNTNSEDSEQTTIIKNLIQNLVLQGSTSIVHILNRILTKDRDDLKRYSIGHCLQESFEIMMKQPSFVNFCRCLALTGPLSSSHIETYKRNNQLRGLIVYLSCFNTEKSLGFILFPLITACGSHDSPLEQKLDLNADEKSFVCKNMEKRIITLCLIQLNQAKNYCDAKLVIDVLIDYTRSHWNDVTEYRNVMECCSVLMRIQKNCILSNDETLSLLESLHETLSVMTQSERTKPIVTILLKVLREVHYNLSNMEHGDCEVHLYRTIELASRTNDHDILDEFLQFFKTNTFDLAQMSKCLERYIDFVWKHVYLNTKETEHRELLGNLAHLLLNIDLKVEPSILKERGIKHRHDIPVILSDILINRFAILPTIELVIEALSLENFALDNHCLERLSKGLQIAIKSEASNLSRLRAFEFVKVIQEKIGCQKPDEVEKLRKYVELNEESDDKMELHSMVDDILNYDLISDGILDCY